MHTIVSELLHLPEGFLVHALTSSEQQVQVTIASTAQGSACPTCEMVSIRLHSHYQRRLVDVPCGGRSVVLLVHSHKWRSANTCCGQQVFAERLTLLAQVQARMTQRCVDAIQQLGLFVNGEGGVRLGRRLGMVTSPTTLLRRVMDLPDPLPPPPVEIGLDDWAYRRGRRYGAILVDLQRRRVIDLLPDRTGPTVVSWLQAHPTVRLVTRDRSLEFATACNQGAPQALQVLDRWHVLHNLTDILPTILAACLHRLRQAHTPAPSDPLTVAKPLPWKLAPAPHWEARRLARQTDRNAQYARLVALQQQGLTSLHIAHQLGMSVRTVTRWLKSFRLDTRRRKRPSILDPYTPHILARWQAGCRNSSLLWREVAQQGFAGSQRTVIQFVKRLRPHHQQAVAPLAIPAMVLPLHRYTVTQLSWLLTRFPQELADTEQEDVQWFCTHDAIVATTYELIQRFRRLVQERQEGQLQEWATQCEACGIPAFQRFLRHLRLQWEPALAAMTQNASNGPTEGFVHKLKLIMRQHYGRAGFALLRKHVLLAG